MAKMKALIGLLFLMFAVCGLYIFNEDGNLFHAEKRPELFYSAYIQRTRARHPDWVGFEWNPPVMPNLTNDHDAYRALMVGGHVVYIASAHVDSRFKRSYVRILGMQPRNFTTKQQLLCGFIEGDGVKKTKAKESIIDTGWPVESLYVAVMWTCQSPTLAVNQVLVSVDRDNTSNPMVLLPIQHQQSTSDSNASNLAICIKPLFGKVHAKRLIEWIEIHRLVGVQKFQLYVGQVANPKDVEFVRQKYNGSDLINWVSFGFPDAIAVDLIDRKIANKYHYFGIHEQAFLIAYNDCLLRSLLYRYLLVIDVDEYFLPTNGEMILSMMERAIRDEPASFDHAVGYMFPTGWYYQYWDENDNPSKLTTNEKRNTTSTTTSTGDYFVSRRNRTKVMDNQPKSIVRPAFTLTMNWHGAVTSHPDSGHGLSYFMGFYQKYAYVHHFRHSCVKKFYLWECMGWLRQSELDQTLAMFTGRVIQRTEAIMRT